MSPVEAAQTPPPRCQFQRPPVWSVLPASHLRRRIVQQAFEHRKCCRRCPSANWKHLVRRLSGWTTRNNPRREATALARDVSMPFGPAHVTET